MGWVYDCSVAISRMRVFGRVAWRDTSRRRRERFFGYTVFFYVGAFNLGYFRSNMLCLFEIVTIQFVTIIVEDVRILHYSVLL